MSGGFRRNRHVRGFSVPDLNAGSASSLSMPKKDRLEAYPTSP